MKPLEHAQYVIDFINTYFYYNDNQKAAREAACLQLQYTSSLTPPEKDDLLIGRCEMPCVGFAMQDNGMGYYLNEGAYQTLCGQLPQDLKESLSATVSSWASKTGKQQLIDAMTPAMREIIPTEKFGEVSNVGFWLCRMSSTQLDFDKLLRLGLPGLLKEIQNARLDSADPDQEILYEGMELFLQSLKEIILHSRQLVLNSAHPEKSILADTLEEIAYHKPSTFRGAVQLMYIYALVSGTYNYGRMDEYLGDFFVSDLAAHRLTEEEAEEILVSLWTLMNLRKTTWDGRVIIGGRGRRNETAANKLACSVIRVANRVRDILPQLSLRFYEGQDPALEDLAFSVFQEGCVYPMLYNDDVNIPAVEKAFHVSREEAEQYTPFGCGEYVLYHRSVGTPSDIINLLKALEITLFNGYDHVSGRQISLETGSFSDFSDFDSFFAAYCQQLERYIHIHAEHQRLEYRVAAEHSPFLAASLLYDDCIARGKAIYDGGVRYLGATLETYGNINTADSLTAIKKLVFEDHVITPEKLQSMLLNNFEGYEEERKLLLAAPKYGNDDPEADAMAARVENHVCEATRQTAAQNDLHSHLVVVINNSANTTLGGFTMASADGRYAKEPMANANNPSGGSDKNGLTCLLNSLASFPVGNNAGNVQNIKFSKSMFARYPEKIRSALKVYFQKGGSQIMLNIVGRGDLEKALLEPEKYRNLIVRVGGFCARFVELEPKVQQEVLSRTLY